MNLAAQTKMTGEPSGGASAAPPPPPADIAAKFPQLEILECLGRGGMGVVYKARQPLLNRLVALKILAPEKEKDPQFAERFTREAQALARLNHPNIVTVFDFGETGGLYYLLMEYVDGVTLRQLLAAGKVAPEQALVIVPRICEALQFAHEQGIVHRDIKPENVLLDKQGRVKIADFGIAKLMGEQGGPGAFYTKGRMVVGTPYYMAPEQVENPLQVDHRADIYSLGVVFYEMLTGELPLGRFSLPSEKVQIDVRLDEVVLHALEKQPSRRYQQASQVKTDLDSIAGTGAKAAGDADVAGATAGSSFGAGNPFGANNPFGAKNPFGANPGAVPGGPPVAQAPRMSRAAVWGACWAALFFAVFPAFFMHEVQTHEFEKYGPFSNPLVIFSFSVFILPSFLAPLGVTILGWVACGHIRRSAGRLHGMWLAVFDGLLFPLLALDGLIWLMCYFATIAVYGSAEMPPDRYLAIFYLSSMVICLVADVAIVWAVWRAVNRPAVNGEAANGGKVVAPPMAAVPAKARSDGTWKITGIVAAVILMPLLAAIILVVGFVGFFHMPARRVALQEVQPMQAVSDSSKKTAEQQMQAIQLRQAQDALALAQKKADVGLITTGELQAAKDQVEIAKAQINGDAVKIAQAQLRAAQNQWQIANQQYQVGIITQDAVMAAKNEVERLEVNLQVAEKVNRGGGENISAGQPGPYADPAAPVSP